MASGLGPNDTILRGGSLTSANGQYNLTLQEDGNLVLYEGDQALWSSNTHGVAVSQAIMQSDGNFVIYGFPNSVWASGTSGPGAFLLVQDDGNVVIYEPNAPLWSTNTTQS